MKANNIIPGFLNKVAGIVRDKGYSDVAKGLDVGAYMMDEGYVSEDGIVKWVADVILGAEVGLAFSHNDNFESPHEVDQEVERVEEAQESPASSGWCHIPIVGEYPKVRLASIKDTDPKTGETWGTHPNFPDFEFSETGRIRRKKTQIKLKGGVMRTSLINRKGEMEVVRVPKLIYEVFRNMRVPSDMVVKVMDEDKGMQLSNLKLVPRSRGRRTKR